MAGLLDGAIASAVFAGFKGRLLKGKLRRKLTTGTPDSRGDSVTASHTLYNFEGFAEEFTDMNRPDGIPVSDLMVNLFAKSLPAGVRPLKDDQAMLRQAGVETWYQLRNAGIDPAGALWTCRGFVIPAPLESE